jgi:hypothetical protein
VELIRGHSSTWRRLGGENGRRNIDPEARSYLRGKRYQIERKREGRPGKLPENQEVSGATRERLAGQYGVAPSTIDADAAFAEAVDTWEEEVRSDLRFAVALQGGFECRAGGIEAVNLVPMRGQWRSGRGTLLRGPHLKPRLDPAARARSDPAAQTGHVAPGPERPACGAAAPHWCLAKGSAVATTRHVIRGLCGEKLNSYVKETATEIHFKKEGSTFLKFAEIHICGAGRRGVFCRGGIYTPRRGRPRQFRFPRGEVQVSKGLGDESSGFQGGWGRGSRRRNG